ncbi:MAG: ABC transporter substrate-binding protein [Prochlorothrix sp.]|nr:ABC transporter substrate-binding protein [Prochlorothrix sp.]
MTYDSDLQLIKCPKCNHDQNPSTARKCEICGFQLHKSKPNFLLIGGVIALLGLGGGAIAFRDQLPFLGGSSGTNGATGSAGSTGNAGSPLSVLGGLLGNDQIQDRLSRGDRILSPELVNPAKEAGVAAFAAGDFATAATQWESSLQTQQNDPEARIYLNNAQVGSNPSFTLAAVVPISETPNPSLEILRGVAQAQEEMVAAGVPVQVLIVDDGNDADLAVSIAQALVADSSVIAVIGHGTSTPSVAAAPIYTAGQLPMIAPTSTSTELTQLAKGDDGVNYIFRTIPNDQFTGTALARYALGTMGKKNAILFFNPNSSYSQSLKDAFVSTFNLEGGSISQEVDLSQGNPTEALATATGDLVVLLPNSSTFEPAVAVVKANQQKLPILAGDAFYRIESLQQVGAELQGAILSVPWHSQASPNAEFVSTSTALWGGLVNWRTALAYDVGQVFRSAQASANLVPTGDASLRSTLAQTIAQSGFQATGATGGIQFTPSGDRNGGVVLLTVQPGSTSGTGFDFVPMP